MTAQGLPRLLSQPDYAKRAESEIALHEEMNNDEFALRLGRAFIKGRLDQFLNLTIHVEPGAAPPFPTQEENDLYAGGYQYSFDSNMHDEIAEEKGHPDPEQLAKAMQVHKRLEEISAEIDKTGLTLELVNERLDLRSEITTMTLANLMEGMEFLKAQEPLEVVMRRANSLFNERRPLATGRPDDDAQNKG